MQVLADHLSSSFGELVVDVSVVLLFGVELTQIHGFN